MGYPWHSLENVENDFEENGHEASGRWMKEGNDGVVNSSLMMMMMMKRKRKQTWKYKTIMGWKGDLRKQE